MKLHTFVYNLTIARALKQKNTRAEQIEQIKKRRNALPNVDSLTKGILNGDKTALAKAITLIESANPNHFSLANGLLEKCLYSLKNPL